MKKINHPHYLTEAHSKHLFYFHKGDQNHNDHHDTPKQADNPPYLLQVPLAKHHLLLG
jgi:hypothetical protein